MKRASTLNELSKTVSRSTPLTAGQGFTLIELLVVITIIVVLLALLTPALDKALYQASLVICQTQQKAVAGGTLLYAFEQKRYYFDRACLKAGEMQPLILADEYGNDDRKLLSPYIPLKMFLDPLADSYPIDATDTAPLSRVHSSYELWFGVRYSNYTSPDGTAISPSGMKKVGDRFSWYDDYDYSFKRYMHHKFRLLTSDLDFAGVNQDPLFNSHPDSNGVLALDTQRTSPGAASPVPATPLDAVKENYSRWSSGRAERGKTDSNYAYDDGSVVRLTGLSLNYDEHLAAVPYRLNNGAWSSLAVQIPRQ